MIIKPEMENQVQSSPFSQDSRYHRSEEEDMQKAISYLYEFRKKLDTLHPNCLNIISHILQDRSF